LLYTPGKSTVILVYVYHRLLNAIKVVRPCFHGWPVMKIPVMFSVSVVSSVLEFLNNLWGGRNRVGIGLSYLAARLHMLAESFLGIDSCAPYKFKNTGTGLPPHLAVRNLGSSQSFVRAGH
jgi:hypothetical protein